MNVQVLCDNLSHPIRNQLYDWVNLHSNNHDIALIDSAKDITEGDILFLISCGEIIKSEQINSFRCVLVIHASDLPKGRGWSPHIWQILEGTSEIIVSLLEAEAEVDSGRIWKKLAIKVHETDLYDDINRKLFKAELELMEWAMDNIESVEPVSQSGEISYYSKRTPADSELNIDLTLKSLFPLIRVCDPDRYPAFFNYGGETYTLKVEKVKKDV